MLVVSMISKAISINRQLIETIINNISSIDDYKNNLTNAYVIYDNQKKRLIFNHSIIISLTIMRIPANSTKHFVKIE